MGGARVGRVAKGTGSANSGRKGTRSSVVDGRDGASLDHRSAGTKTEQSAATSSQPGVGGYPCAMCEQSFRDADALNEHYQVHFENCVGKSYEVRKA